MYCGDNVFGKVREASNQKYTSKKEVIDIILEDFRELQQMEKYLLYLEISYNPKSHTRKFLNNLNIYDLDLIQLELSKYIRYINNINNHVTLAAKQIKSGIMPNIIIRQIQLNVNDPFIFNNIINGLIFLGLYIPPTPNQSIKPSLVYDSTIDHSSDSLSKNTTGPDYISGLTQNISSNKKKLHPDKKNKYNELTSIKGQTKISKKVRKVTKKKKKASKELLKRINRFTRKKNKLTNKQNKLIKARNKLINNPVHT